MKLNDITVNAYIFFDDTIFLEREDKQELNKNQIHFFKITLRKIINKYNEWLKEKRRKYKSE